MLNEPSSAVDARLLVNVELKGPLLVSFLHAHS